MRKLDGIDMNKEPADEVGNRTGTSVKSPDLYLSPDQNRTNGRGGGMGRRYQTGGERISTMQGSNPRPLPTKRRET